MKTTVLGLVTAVVIVAAIVGGYVAWQRQAAVPPPLGDIPAGSSDVALEEITGPQLSAAQDRLRQSAEAFQPGYGVAEARFFAKSPEVVWDSMRHVDAAYLDAHGYSLRRDENDTIGYLLYGHDNWLQRKFNDDLILVAGYIDETLPTNSGGQARLYGYFRLSQNP